MTATRLCDTCYHPDTTDHGWQRVMLGMCDACPVCIAGDPCPRCGGDHDRIDPNEPCPGHAEAAQRIVAAQERERQRASA